MSEDIQYLSVKALTRYLKRKFDADPYLQKVYVTGEVSNFRLRPGGHQYFSLKEENVKINVAMFQHAFNKLPFQLEEGMKVYAIGRVSLYEPSGSYQITLESIQPDGIGALYLALEQLKQKLQQEGALDLPKKRPVAFPKRIAVITSPSGAVIRDIATTLKRRYPIAQIVVFPTRVQGKEAVGEIVAAFERLNQKVALFDTVILARGGGSIEDLWCFNDEAVARAILACPLPVITAIGHETDTTIADLVGDLRAPTPTAAAEMAAPELSLIYQHLAQSRARLTQAMQQRLKHAMQRLNQIQSSYILTQPERLYQAYTQQVDLLQERLLKAQRYYVKSQQHRTQLMQQRLLASRPSNRIALANQQVKQLQRILQQAMHYYIAQQQQKIGQQAQLLEAYSPLKILSRGYAIATKEQGTQTLRSVAQVQVDDTLAVRLVDGTIETKVIAVGRDDERKE